MGWAVHCGDDTWREEELTLGQSVMLQDLTGDAWPSDPRRSAKHLMSTLAVFLCGGDPKRLDESLAQLYAVDSLTAIRMVTLSGGGEDGDDSH